MRLSHLSLNPGILFLLLCPLILAGALGTPAFAAVEIEIWPPQSPTQSTPDLQGFEDGGPHLSMTALTNRYRFSWSTLDGGGDFSLQSCPQLVVASVNPFFWNWTYTTQVTNQTTQTISTEFLAPVATRPFRPDAFFRLRRRTPTFQASLMQNDVLTPQRMGTSISASHDAIMTGAPGVNPSERGVVMIMSRETLYHPWFELDRLYSNLADPAGDRFGTAVATAGDWYYISAPGAAGKGGQIHTFERTEIAIILRHDVYAPTDAVDTELGASLAQALRIVFIGEPHHRRSGDAPDARRGQVRIYDTARKTLLTSLQGPSGVADIPGALFGKSVAASEDGKWLLVGAPGAYSDAAKSVVGGAAFLYEKQADGSWTTAPTLLTTPSARAGDRCGSSVTISRNHLVIGCPGRDGNGADSGVVSVFRRDIVKGWIHSVTLTGNQQSAGDQFGFSVALSGDLLLVGAPYDDTSSGADAGSFTTFFRNESSTGVGTWQMRFKSDLLPASQFNPGAHLGWSVTAQGYMVGAGAPLQLNERGKVVVGLEYMPALFFP